MFGFTQITQKHIFIFSHLSRVVFSCSDSFGFICPLRPISQPVLLNTMLWKEKNYRTLQTLVMLSIALTTTPCTSLWQLQKTPNLTDLLCQSLRSYDWTITVQERSLTKGQLFNVLSGKTLNNCCIIRCYSWEVKSVFCDWGELTL